jgi:hypothetical protein
MHHTSWTPFQVPDDARLFFCLPRNQIGVIFLLLKSEYEPWTDYGNDYGTDYGTDYGNDYGTDYGTDYGNDFSFIQ